jgi:protein TIF31
MSESAIAADAATTTTTTTTKTQAIQEDLKSNKCNSQADINIKENENNDNVKSEHLDECCSNELEQHIQCNGVDTPNIAKEENELILIQDNAFTVKIHVNGVEPFDLQVTSMELVQEIHQMLMDKEETCHRTCFSLQLDGVALDNFSELKSIEGLKDGSIIRLVDEPYTVREVRLHVRHINDLMHSIDPIDNFNAINCNSLTYVNDITVGEGNIG